MTTYGVKCGIATYSEHLAQELSKEHEVEVVIFAEDYIGNAQGEFKTDLKVVRCFNRNHPDQRLIEALQSFNPHTIHIQHEFGVFKNLTETLREIAAQFVGRTVITIHTVKTGNKFDLQDCAQYFIVHKISGKEHLVEEEEINPDRIEVISHGTLLVPQIPSKVARLKLGLPLDRKIVLSHAFFGKRKNIDKIIKSVADLKNELPIYYVHVGGVHPHSPENEGKAYLHECLRLIEELGVGSEVQIIPKFIPDKELTYYLNAYDVIVTLENSIFPNIVASGIMHIIAPNKPVIASNVINFDDFPGDAFYRLNPEYDLLNIALREVLTNPELSNRLNESLLQYAEETSWDRVAQEHVKLYHRCLRTLWDKPITGVTEPNNKRNTKPDPARVIIPDKSIMIGGIKRVNHKIDPLKRPKKTLPKIVSFTRPLSSGSAKM